MRVLAGLFIVWALSFYSSFALSQTTERLECDYVHGFDRPFDDKIDGLYEFIVVSEPGCTVPGFIYWAVSDCETRKQMHITIRQSSLKNTPEDFDFSEDVDLFRTFLRTQSDLDLMSEIQKFAENRSLEIVFTDDAPEHWCQVTSNNSEFDADQGASQ